MDMRKRNIWQYWKDNAMIYPAFAIFLGIGIFSIADKVWPMTIFMGVCFITSIIASFLDLRKNG